MSRLGKSLEKSFGALGRHCRPAGPLWRAAKGGPAYVRTTMKRGMSTFGGRMLAAHDGDGVDEVAHDAILLSTRWLGWVELS